MSKKAALIIMDGFGIAAPTAGNAIAQANTPNLDKLFSDYPCSQLFASGLDVGLPEGQMGNSEVGHTNMGAGRVVWQELSKITNEIEEGSFIAEAEDVTALLGTDELEAHKNEFVAFKGMTIAPIANADGAESAFLYNWDGSGEDGSDLYFKVTKDDQEFTFTVESYLCGPGTDVYEAVKALNVGDVVDLEGFLYWYNGANPHITSVSAAE